MLHFCLFRKHFSAHTHFKEVNSGFIPKLPNRQRTDPLSLVIFIVIITSLKSLVLPQNEPVSTNVSSSTGCGIESPCTPISAVAGVSGLRAQTCDHLRLVSTSMVVALESSCVFLLLLWWISLLCVLTGKLLHDLNVSALRRSFCWLPRATSLTFWMREVR